MSGARHQAIKELKLFTFGAAAGTAFVMIALFLVPGYLTGMVAFIWVATRIEYALVIAIVIDLVMHPKDPEMPRYMPVTGLAAGGALPVVLVTLHYLY